MRLASIFIKKTLARLMDKMEIDIVPARGITFDLWEIWRKRELLYFFAWRDLRVKYKQTYLGILWSILQPVLMMILIYFVVHRTFNINVSSIPYPIFVFSGILLWGLFSSIVTNSSESMIVNAPIIRKIYFPRLIIPVSVSLVSLVDFIFAFLVYLVLLIGFRQPVSWSAILCFPIAIMMTLLSALGIGTLLAAMNVKYRDFRYLLPFLIQLLFFASQIIYSINHLPEGWLKYIMYCLPFNGALEIFRYPIDPAQFYATGLYISIGSMFLFLLLGVSIFKKTEAFFADII